MSEDNIPSNSELWIMGVKGWMEHIEGGYVERRLRLALDYGSDVQGAILWLQQTGCGPFIGQVQHIPKKGICWSTYTRLVDVEYLRIGWDGKLLISTSMASILEWLQAGKKRVPVQE